MREMAVVPQYILLKVMQEETCLLKEATAINNIKHKITDILETAGIDPHFVAQGTTVCKVGHGI